MNTEDEMISVPAQVLQDLIHNIELASIGVEATSLCEQSIERQYEELQGYLTDDDYVDPNEGFTLDDCENVHFVNFRKRTWC